MYVLNQLFNTGTNIVIVSIHEDIYNNYIIF